MNRKSPADITALQRTIASELRSLGEGTPYVADANEPDPRYLGYGVRAPEMKQFLAGLKGTISTMSAEEKVELAKCLIASRYGEQKGLAIALLERTPGYFSPDRFKQLEGLVKGLHGWSKIDSITKQVLPNILERHETEMISLLERWNVSDDPWLRRASVVIFTRKTAKSTRFKQVALRFCEALVHDKEHLVQTGVGWCLRDLMRWHKEDVLPYVIDLRKRGITSKITLYALRDIKGDERKSILSKRTSPG